MLGEEGMDGRSTQKALEGRGSSRKEDVRHLSFLWLLPTSLKHGEKNPHGRRWVAEYSVELPCAESLERMALSVLLLLQPEHDEPFPTYRVTGGRRQSEDVIAGGSSVSCNMLMFLCPLLGKCVKCFWMVLRSSGQCCTGIVLVSSRRRKISNSLKW